MISTKQRAYLRGLANPLKPSLTIGKGEIDDSLIKAIDNALTAHELIKIKVLPTCEKELGDLLNELSLKTESEPINRLGRILTLYRHNENKKEAIVLPA